MSKVTLSECWIYNGVRYGPGEVDVPDDVRDVLQARGAFEAADAAPAKAPAAKAPVKGDKE